LIIFSRLLSEKRIDELSAQATAKPRSIQTMTSGLGLLGDTTSKSRCFARLSAT
jgi:hypothetical protein